MATTIRFNLALAALYTCASPQQHSTFSLAPRKKNICWCYRLPCSRYYAKCSHCCAMLRRSSRSRNPQSAGVSRRAMRWQRYCPDGRAPRCRKCRVVQICVCGSARTHRRCCGIVCGGASWELLGFIGRCGFFNGWGWKDEGNWECWRDCRVRKIGLWFIVDEN